MKPEFNFEADAALLPRVSLFHMSYNQASDIRTAAEASLAQDYPNLQIVFSDDCSTDDTYEILQEIVAAYDGPHEVKLTRNARNRGIVGNFNTLIEKTDGALIVQANGDDISMPDRVSRLVAKWQESDDTAIVFSTMRRLDEAGNPVGLMLGANLRDAGLNPPPESMLIDTASVTGACAAYDRRIFDRFGPVSTQAIYEDRIMPFRARLIGRISKVEDPLVDYRPGGSSWPGESAADLARYEKWMLRTREADARAYLSELGKYDFDGKYRVMVFAIAQVIRVRLYRTPLAAVVRRLLPRSVRVGFRNMLAGSRSVGP